MNDRLTIIHIATVHSQTQTDLLFIYFSASGGGGDGGIAEISALKYSSRSDIES